jgi:two-component system cell cycle response regulator
MDAAALTANLIIHSQAGDVSATLRLEARVRLIWIEFQNAQNGAAHATAQAAIREACAIEDPVRESRARSLYARVLAEGVEGDKAADEVVAALRLARSTNDALARSLACANLARICARMGLYDAAVDLAQQAVDQAGRSHDTEAIALAISNNGSLHADYLYRYRSVPEAQRQEYLAIAISESRRATVFAQTHQDWEMQRRSGYNLSEFLLMSGDLAGAEAAMRETDAAAGTPSRRARVHGGHAKALLLLGQGDPSGLAALERNLARCLAYPFRQLAMFASEHRSRLLAEIGCYRDAFYEHQRFHALFVEHCNQEKSWHVQYRIILDQVEEMQSLAAVENARAERLAREQEALSSEAKRLSQESLQDALTGLANRRQLDNLLVQLATERRPHAIAILDLDHFKQVNDHFSHAIGDRVLRQVAKIFNATLSQQDSLTVRLAVRLGGEEFALALAAEGEAITLIEARTACEAVRRAIATYEWTDIARGLAVTASMGLAMSEEAPDSTGRMRIADARLYDAKRSGRDRLISDDSCSLPRG